MAFGNFLGGFADAFSRTQFGIQEQERRDKENKLRSQLFEIQLQKLQREGASQDKFAQALDNAMSEAMRSQNPLANPALGGSPVQPGEALSEATAQPPPSLLESLAGNSELLSAAIGAGEIGVGDILQGQPAGRQPKELALLGAMGIDPKSKEGTELLMSSMLNSKDSTAEMMAQLQLESVRNRNLEQQAKLDAQAAAGAKESRLLESSIRTDFNQYKRIVKLQRDLEKKASLLAPGVPFAEVLEQLGGGASAGLAAFGIKEVGPIDFKKFDEARAMRDLLIKEFGELSMAGLERMRGSGVSDMRFRGLESSLPVITNVSSANEQVFGTMTEALLEGAFVNEVKLTPAQRKEMEDAVKEWRAAKPADSDPIVDLPQTVAEIKALTLEQVAGIGLPRLKEELSPELKRVLVERLEQLRAEQL